MCGARRKWQEQLAAEHMRRQLVVLLHLDGTLARLAARVDAVARHDGELHHAISRLLTTEAHAAGDLLFTRELSVGISVLIREGTTERARARLYSAVFRDECTRIARCLIHASLNSVELSALVRIYGAMQAPARYGLGVWCDILASATECLVSHRRNPDHWRNNNNRLR